MADNKIIDGYTDEELLKRLIEAKSFKDFLEDLGYSNGRAQYTRKLAEKRFISMGVDYRDIIKPSNYHGALASRIPDERYYIRGTFRGSKLSRRVRTDGHVDYRCNICKNTGEWLDKEITLHLDHIDGDSKNNEIANLRFLCPNCHSQTETYGGRNIGKIKA